ncbi:MAG: hypothetical protein BWY51_00361 [Parcubacteria group bacterium ADurb.Bin316]|nr:MAG: hypothetical protein BWY51_00361 [Parcubacteria group bacterium ADurb.Bin316]HOZ55953.1 DUF4325 domain-containing protein [bacterium]
MVIALKKFGTILTSRQMGKEASAAFRPSLSNLKKDEIIEIDFEGVSVLSPSWGDEFLTPLILEYKDRLILKNTKNPSVQATFKTLKEIHRFELLEK